jgi:hypothetical protein
LRLFVNYLKDFLREDFHKGYYLSIAVLIATAITVNYTIDLEDGIIDRVRNFYLRSGSFFLLYFGLYLLIILINQFFYKENSFWRYKMFWMNLIIGFALFSFDAAFQPSRLLADVPSELRIFSGKMLSNLISIFSIFLPFWLYYKFIDQSQPSLYGLTRKGFVARPYLYLFSIVIPLVIVGSFLPGFQQQYPMYISSNAHEYLNVPEWITVISYEMAYGWNFLTIELLFRGFLVIGMVKLLGRHAILPMAIVYASIHFGKPLGECISSIFGGYILGVIAYYSRNIWGGVVIHVGLAWLMEIVSATQKALF